MTSAARSARAADERMENEDDLFILAIRSPLSDPSKQAFARYHNRCALLYPRKPTKEEEPRTTAGNSTSRLVSLRLPLPLIVVVILSTFKGHHFISKASIAAFFRFHGPEDALLDSSSLLHQCTIALIR